MVYFIKVSIIIIEPFCYSEAVDSVFNEYIKFISTSLAIFIFLAINISK